MRAAIFQMEQDLLSLLSAEQERRDVLENRDGSAPDEWFTLAELGNWLKVSRTTAYKLVRERHIPTYRIGRATRIRRRNVEQWLEDEVRIG